MCAVTCPTCNAPLAFRASRRWSSCPICSRAPYKALIEQRRQADRRRFLTDLLCAVLIVGGAGGLLLLLAWAA